MAERNPAALTSITATAVGNIVILLMRPPQPQFFDLCVGIQRPSKCDQITRVPEKRKIVQPCAGAGVERRLVSPGLCEAHCRLEGKGGSLVLVSGLQVEQCFGRADSRRFGGFDLRSAGLEQQQQQHAGKQRGPAGVQCEISALAQTVETASGEGRVVKGMTEKRELPPTEECPLGS